MRRTAPLLGLTARSVGDAIAHSAKRRIGKADSSELHARSAERYAELLGRSRGALMKAGQMISFVSLGPAIPGEFKTAYQAALGRLRTDAEPMDFEVALEVLERELGRSADTVFSELSAIPLATASIGQVHAGRLHDGREVAVKIQYPGVDDAIRADLRNGELLATFLHLIISLFPRRVRLDPRTMAAEVQHHIRAELDYRLEAEHQALFADLYRGHPFIHVPDVIGTLSTGRVLTQDLAHGIGWDGALSAEQRLKDMWGEAIFRFAYGSFRQFGIYNADAHPGNYLFHADGSVSFLDFGCVVSMPPEMVELVVAMVSASVAGDIDGQWQAALAAGIWHNGDPVTPQDVDDYLREQHRHLWDAQPFTITPEWVDAIVERRNSPAGPAANAMSSLTAPPGWTILARMDTEVRCVLAALRATSDWASINAEWRDGAAPVTEMGKAHQEFVALRMQPLSGA